jgi:hypothetical protein
MMDRRAYKGHTIERVAGRWVTMLRHFNTLAEAKTFITNWDARYGRS